MSLVMPVEIPPNHPEVWCGSVRIQQHRRLSALTVCFRIPKEAGTLRLRGRRVLISQEPPMTGSLSLHDLKPKSLRHLDTTHTSFGSFPLPSSLLIQNFSSRYS